MASASVSRASSGSRSLVPPRAPRPRPARVAAAGRAPAVAPPALAVAAPAVSVAAPASAGPVPPAWKQRLIDQQPAHLAMMQELVAGAPEGVQLDAHACLVRADVLRWLRHVPDGSVHAIVTDPPYGLVEYEEADHTRLREGRGGVWRVPPAFDGHQRSPLPRFTTLTAADRRRLVRFFTRLGRQFHRILVPGGHLMMASNPLVSTLAFAAVGSGGLEKRGEIIRLVQTMRGGDRPKGAHTEFADVTVMPRSAWEPWGLYRKPCEGTVADNLRRWGTGGLRRLSEEQPFRDVIPCAPTRAAERALAPHPSLKPQRLLRQLVRASLPFGLGVVLDPFSGSGSTLAAASHLGYLAFGAERDREYYGLAQHSFPRLRDLLVR